MRNQFNIYKAIPRTPVSVSCCLQRVEEGNLKNNIVVWSHYNWQNILDRLDKSFSLGFTQTNDVSIYFDTWDYWNVLDLLFISTKWLIKTIIYITIIV